MSAPAATEKPLREGRINEKRSIYIPRVIWNKLEEKAKKSKRSVAYIMREILGEHLRVPEENRHGR